jgi:hypothetical protein
MIELFIRHNNFISLRFSAGASSAPSPLVRFIRLRFIYSIPSTYCRGFLQFSVRFRVAYFTSRRARERYFRDATRQTLYRDEARMKRHARGSVIFS